MVEERPAKVSELGRTQCSECGATIAQGEERTIVAIVNLCPQDVDDEGEVAPEGPRAKVVRTYCDVCKGKEPHFTIANPWHLEQQVRAEPSAGPRSEDVAYRFQSDNELARKLGRTVESEDREDDVADLKANLYSAVPIPDPRSPFRKVTNAPAPSAPSRVETEDAQKEQLQRFLADPSSRGMRPQVRDVARRWIEGKTQTEIAQALKIDQSTVSRHIRTALALAKKPR